MSPVGSQQEARCKHTHKQKQKPLAFPKPKRSKTGIGFEEYIKTQVYTNFYNMSRKKQQFFN